MTLLAQVGRLLSKRLRSAAARQGRILIVGDSHVAAFEHAVGFAKEDAALKQVEVYRFAKAKGDISIGNITFEDFLDLIGNLDRRDYIFSAIGGNQYAVISTVQHPVDLEFLTSPSDCEIDSEGAMFVPNRVVSNYFHEALKGVVGEKLEALRSRTNGNIFHLVPPPPKEDNAFIAKNCEERFRELGIDELGPSRPKLRLKAWKLQLQALEKICSQLGIKLLMPPAHTMTESGFLAQEYYANDATHANRRYGRDSLKQIFNLIQSDAAARQDFHQAERAKATPTNGVRSRIHG